MFLCNMKEIEEYIGYYIAKEIYDNNGRKLLHYNIVINEKIIESLRSHGIYSVNISKEPINEEEKNKEENTSHQLNSLNFKREELKNIFNDVSKEVLYQKKENKPNISISQKSLQKIEKTIESILNRIIDNPIIAMSLPSLQLKDNFILKHSINVSYMSLCLVTTYPAILNILRDEKKGIIRFESKKSNSLDSYLIDIGMSAFLHDIGLIYMSDDILKDELYKKNNPVWEEIKKHPIIGHDMLFGKNINSHALLGIKYHHENMDGSGYPFGIKEYKIHPYSRIINLIESYEAMISDSPGKPAKDFRTVLGEILALSGKRYDPEISTFFVDLILGGKSGLIEKGEIIK